MKLDDKVAKIDKTFTDLKRFADNNEYEYAAMLVRTIVEIIVNSYTDYYAPGIKASGEIPDLLTQINELNKCNHFSYSQIYNLHAMRKMSNKGSHQGTEESINPVEILGLIPTIETEIKAWKTFASEGHESLHEIKKQQEQELLNSSLEIAPNKLKSAFITTIVSLIVILFFTYKQTINFLTLGIHYETEFVPAYWGCLLAFFIIASYLRKYSKIHRILFDLFALYFGLPRVLQIILCFIEHESLGNTITYIALAFIILGGYSFLTLCTTPQKGGIVGYK